ncbi:MAG: hypothetical protein P1P85_00715 [Patescibacteria group bacterium]|nr:hypothetical protein [Patescibacteria group bacterium]
MADNENSEMAKKIEKIIKYINNSDLLDWKKTILRGNSRSMLETIDAPDCFHDTRERVGYLAAFVLAVMFMLSAFLIVWLENLWSDSFLVGVWILLILFRAIFLPSLDNITLNIIKSKNDTLRKLFIKPKKIKSNPQHY